MFTRLDGRRPDELRPVRIDRGFTKAAPGSVLIHVGETRVLCTACFEKGVPEWMEGKGVGWLTAEYDMLPASTGQRKSRNRGGKVDGRTTEIQRLIGRCLRAIVDRKKLGENTIWLDCDVIQADGGTRCAAVTGAYVALCDAVAWSQKQGWVGESPVTDAIAAVSAGKVRGELLLDLPYAEDSIADADCNVAMTGGGTFVEVQASAEASTYDWNEMQAMVRMAEKGITNLLRIQREAMAK